MVKTQPIFHVQKLGGLANQMIQYLVALSVADRVEGCRLSNIRIDEWNINHPALPLPRVKYEQRDPQYVDVESLSTLLQQGDVGYIEYVGYGQRVENFLPVERCRDVFVSDYTGRLGYGADELVISIRGGEIMTGVHPGYVLLPIDFYEELIRNTGLKPVFLGQIGTDPYCNALRQRFPHARFVGSMGPVMDFEAIRGSVNIVPSVSTFSWLAAWLSHATNIFMPLTGLFNPGQFRTHDFAPLDDPRFHYTWFPANYGAPVRDFEVNHRALLGRWKPMDRAGLTRLKAPNFIVHRSKDKHVALFDQTFYKARYGDIERAIMAGMPSALFHYIRTGFAENREPFRIDRAWYARSYADAADAIGRGEFSDIYHHYSEIGIDRGYLPVRG